MPATQLEEGDIKLRSGSRPQIPKLKHGLGNNYKVDRGHTGLVGTEIIRLLA